MRGILMPIYDRYIGWLYIKMTLMCFLGVLMLVVLIDNLEQFDEFAKFARNNDKNFMEMLWILIQHYSAYAPTLVFLWMFSGLPVMSAVIVITMCSMSNEFTIMRASGVSMRRVIAPVLVLALLIGIGYGVSRDAFLPTLLRRSFVMNNKLRPRDVQPLNVCLSDGDQYHFVSMGHYDTKTGTAYNLRVDARNQDDFRFGHDSSHMYIAKKAILQPYTNPDNPADEHQNIWMPVEGASILKSGRYGRAKSPWETPLPTLVTEAMLERFALSYEVMTGEDLSRLQENLSAQLERHRRYSQPFISFCILMVTLPLILRSTMRGEEASYVANVIIGVAICGTFFLLRSAFIGLGEQEWLSPFAATQAANILFLLIGIHLFIVQDR